MTPAIYNGHNMLDKKQKLTEYDDGLAGVSALIIFIALVLVSAIAAGVILDTAGFLQEKASTTGEESTS
jgi:Archaeal flagellins